MYSEKNANDARNAVMKHVKELARLARSLERLTTVCKQCGVCISACPLYPQTRLERDIARGKIALLEGVMCEAVKNAESVKDRLDRCLLCGGCAGVCPNSVNTQEIFLKARVLITGYLGLSPLKKAIFRKLLARPERFNRVTGLTARTQSLFLKKMDADLGTSCARITASPLLDGRHVVGLAPVPFHRQYRPEANQSRDGGRETVLFFTGCLIDKVFPRTAISAVKALKYHDLNVVLPDNEGCCGIPALSAGDNISFRKLLSHNLKRFRSVHFDHLVTACATCAFTIKKVWPMMVEQEDPDYGFIDEISRKTTDISELIATRLEATPAARRDNAIPVTYHDPCHLKKSLGIDKAPRRLITANPDYELIEMKDADACCGMGGGFGLAYNELSEQIGRRKLGHLLETGCRVVATGCPACMIQLAGLLSRHGEKNMRVCHPVEIYMERKPGS